MRTVRAFAAGVVGAVAVLGGCQASPIGGEPIARPETPQAPSYQEVAERYNERAQHFDRLWARTTVRLRYLDEEGRWQTEQGDDGHLMLVRPDHVALSTGKLGEPFFRLGSNGERFWWFDLRKPRRAWHDETARSRGLRRPFSRRAGRANARRGPKSDRRPGGVRVRPRGGGGVGGWTARGPRPDAPSGADGLTAPAAARRSAPGRCGSPPRSVPSPGENHCAPRASRRGSRRSRWRPAAARARRG